MYVFINCCHVVIVLNDYHVHAYQGLHLGSKFLPNWRSLKYSWALLSFTLWIVVNLCWTCLCVLDAIFELHAMNERMFNDLVESERGLCRYERHV